MSEELKAAALPLFIQHILPLLFVGLASLVSWALAEAARNLHVRARTSKLAAAANRIAHLAGVVVADLEVSLKPELKARTADGVLTTQEVLELRAIALDRLKALAGQHGLKELSALLGIAAPSLDVYLSGVVEQAVSSLPPSPRMRSVSPPAAAEALQEVPSQPIAAS